MYSSISRTMVYSLRRPKTNPSLYNLFFPRPKCHKEKFYKGITNFFHTTNLARLTDKIN